MGKIQKIFITHTHGASFLIYRFAELIILVSTILGDHIFGILPLLASRLNGAGGTVEGVADPRAKASTSQDPTDVRPIHLKCKPPNLT